MKLTPILFAFAACTLAIGFAVTAPAHAVERVSVTLVR